MLGVMDGIKIVIVGFIFVCIIFPALIKNKHQYYLAFAAVLLGLLLEAISATVGSVGFSRVVIILDRLLDITAIVLLVAAAGGLTMKQLMTDMSQAYEAFRHGEAGETTTVHPISGQTPRPASSGGPGESGEEGKTVYIIDDPAARAAPKPPDTGPIPMEEPPQKDNP